MSRDIKFRAWVKDFNPNFLVRFEDIQDLAFDDGYIYFKEGLRSSNYALMQYTGLKDKNGKEIYEDDVIDIICFKCCNMDGHKTRSLVTFKDGAFMCDLTVLLLYAEDIEVIGNIHENPELLKEVEDGQ